MVSAIDFAATIMPFTPIVLPAHAVACQLCAGTPGANNVNLLVQMLLLNYMALNGDQGQFSTVFPNHGLGDPALLDRLIAFAPIA